jgi:hypothetical protein
VSNTGHAPCFMLSPPPTLYVHQVAATNSALLAPLLDCRSLQTAPHHRLLLAPALAPHLRVYCHFEMTALTQVLTFSTEPTVEK